MQSTLRWIAFAGLFCGSIRPVRAQDPFEIHVLQYEPLDRGEFTFETHLNYAGIGAPATDVHLHMTYEVTGGNRTRRVARGDAAQRMAHCEVGLVAEFSFLKGADSRAVEIVPIIEKNWRRLQLDLNPAFGRSLHGPGIRQGWSFGPAARLGT